MPDGAFKSTTIISIALMYLHGFDTMPVLRYTATMRRKDRTPMFWVNCTPPVVMEGDVVFPYGEEYSSLMSVWDYCLQFVPAERLPIFKHNLYNHISAVERYDYEDGVYAVWNKLPNGTLNLNKIIQYHNIRNATDVDRAVNMALDILHLISMWSVYHINK